MPRRQPQRAVAAPIKDEAADRAALGASSSALSPALLVTPKHTDKRAKRHLDDLERSNYTEPSAGATGNLRFRAAGQDDDIGPIGSQDPNEARKRKLQKPTAVQMLLMYRKNLPTLIKESGLAELGPAHPNYLTAAAPPPKRPPIKLCEICGYLGRYTCTRCGIAYCEISCQAIHDETRCERR